MKYLPLLYLFLCPLLWSQELTLGVLYFETSGDENEILTPESHKALSLALTEMTIADLSALRMLTLVERSDLNRIMEEQKLALTGLVDETTAARAGELLGARYLFTGRLILTGSLATLTGRITLVETGEIAAAASRNGPAEQIFTLREELTEELMYLWDIPLSQKERIKLAERDKLTLDGIIQLGNALDASDRGEYDRALTYLDRAVELNPDLTLAADLREEIRRRFESYLDRKESDLPNDIIDQIDRLARGEEGAEQDFSKMYWAYLQPLMMGMSYYGTVYSVDESIRESYFNDYIKTQWTRMGLNGEPASAEELGLILGRKLYRAYRILEYLLSRDLPLEGYNAYLHPVEGGMGYFLTLFTTLPNSPGWQIPPMVDSGDRIVMTREQLYPVLLSYCDMFLANFPYSAYNSMITPLLHFLLSETEKGN